MGQRSHPLPEATMAESSGSKARRVQNSPRQLQLCKELFFAGFPCQQPYRSSNNNSNNNRVNNDVRPLSKKFVRGFFQQYGAVEALFYDEARGMGSVVFADGADAEGCYLAAHLSFLPATTADGGLGQPTWEQDQQGEDMAERQARPRDLLLCLEFAHCCPFVHPVLLTKEVFVDGGVAHCEVPGGELSRGTLFHRFPQLLLWRREDAATAPSAPVELKPVAPHVVVRWQEVQEDEADHGQTASARVEMLEEEEEGKEENRKTEEEAAVEKEKTPQQQPQRSYRQVGPHFPGRGIEPVEIEVALWQLLRPSHARPGCSPNGVVTVLDLWWEYYNTYMVHKTQPAESRIGDAAFRFARRPSLLQELREVQRQGREYAHGDEAAARQVLHRLVYDDQYHNVLSYLSVKEKFKYDPVWASLMRDVYKPKLVAQLEVWQTLVEEKEATERATDSTAAAAAAAAATTTTTAAPDTELRRRRVVVKALKELLEPKPTKTRDIELMRRAEQTWLTLPRTTATANVMENVKFLDKVKRGEVDHNGLDKEEKPKPPLRDHNKEGGKAGEEEEKEVAVDEANIEAAYPSLSTRQKEEQFYAEVMRNLDGYVAIGSAEELVAMCEDPKLFRYAKGHIGYEEAHHRSLYWLAYLNALWVPLIALLLLGFGSYYIVDRLGIRKINEMKQQEKQEREFHTQLHQLLEQQKRMMDTTLEAQNAKELRAAMKNMNKTMRKAAEAARKAGGKFNIEVRGDL